MTRSSTNKLKKAARPIRTKKDYSGAATLVEKISRQPERENAAEQRLKALLKEMDKFDGDDDFAEGDASTDDYSGPMRRWTDDSTDLD